MRHNTKNNDTCFYINKEKLINNLKEFSKIGNVYYPLKANSNKEVLSILKPYINNTENGFLISYMSHYKVLKDLNINTKNICLMNVLSDTETIRFLYDEGVSFFTIDDFELLKDINKYMDLNELRINIRLSTNDIFKNSKSHLGANKKECLEMINYLRNKCNNVGLSFYLGSEIKKEKKYFKSMTDYIIRNFKNNDLKFISIGGVEPFYNVNTKIINNIKQELSLNEIILEPGQNLVGNTVYMKIPIIRIKNINNEKIIIIKNGIFSGFFDKLLYDKNFDFYFESQTDGQVKISNKKTIEKKYSFYLYGGSSDSKDILGEMFIEEKYENELIKNAEFCVKNVGAYVEEFFMSYGNDLNRNYLNI